MKRDMDLVRKILLAIEANTEDPMGWIDIDIPGHDELKISRHLQMLDEARLLEAKDVSSKSGTCWKPKRLTWTGYEFLDSIRDDSRWRSAKNKALEISGGLSLHALQSAIGALIAGQLSG